MFIVTVKAKVEASGRLVLCLLGPNTQHPQAGVTLRIPAGEVEEFIAVVSDLPKIRNSKATYPINKSPFVCGHDGGETSRVVLTSPPLQIEFEIFNDALRSLLQQIKQQMVTA